MTEEHPERDSSAATGRADESTPEWNAIEEVFLEALELPDEERAAFLEKRCGNDTALRREIDEMLTATDGPELVLDRFVQDEAPEPGARIGETVGRYRLLSLIGRGGMGEVYLAERADGAFERKVAIKLLRSGLTTKDAARRFESERQILARLDHPHITRLLDGGTTADGLPFLVMQAESGTPITAYCDNNRLGVDERLRLFSAVGRAIQSAHQQLIVHLDLKPSNVLVTDAGYVRILDFGIARLLDTSTPSATTTDRGARRLTPNYAAPEQLRGDPASAATDVYQLGVLLHELLTGALPERASLEAPSDRIPPQETYLGEFEFRERSGSHSLDDLPTPSRAHARATHPPKLRARIAGDLKHIVLKALRFEPSLRYSSAGALIEDVERHEHHIPVRARKDTTAYKLRLFVRRNRLLVGSATVVLAAILGLGGAAIRQGQIAANQRDRAELEVERSEEVVGLLVDLFEASNPVRNPGADTLSLGQFLANSEQDVLSELDGRPDVLYKIQAVLGRIRRERGDREEALALLSAAQENLTLADGSPEDATDLAHLIALDEARDQGSGLSPQLEESLARHREVYGDPSMQLAVALLDIAAQLDDGEARIETIEESMQMMRDLLGTGVREQRIRIGLAEGLNTLAVHYYRLGRYTDAVGPLEEALETVQSVYPPEHHYVLQVKGNLSAVLVAVDRLDDAAAVREGVLDARRRLFDDPHPAIANDLSGLGNLALRRERYEEADSLFSLSLAQSKQLGEPRAIARVSRNLAITRIYVGQYESALELLNEAVPIQEAEQGLTHSASLEMRSVRAGVLSRLRPIEAVDSLRGLIAQMEAIAPEEGAGFLADAHGSLGQLLVPLDPVEAESYLRSARQFQATALGTDAPLVHYLGGWLAVARARQGHLGESVPLIRAAYEEIADNSSILEVDREKLLTELLRLEEELRTSPNQTSDLR